MPGNIDVAQLKRKRDFLKWCYSQATMEIDPRRLRVLRAVALRGGVMDAARLLHLTPSAVSQQLAQLEREVGVPLVDRSRRRVELTPEGRLLATRAERIESELLAARRELAAMSGRVSGPVVAAGFLTAIRRLLVPALERLAATHPEVEPSVVELEDAPALRELRTGGIHVAIAERDAEAPGPGVRGIAVEPLLDDEYRVVVPEAWATRPRSILELAATPWVASPPERSCGAALERLAAEHGFTPRRAHVCSEFPSVLALVGAGHGAAIVPLLALADGPADAVAVTSIPGAGFRRLSALHRAGASEPVVGVMLGALREAAAALAVVGISRGR
jgi:DNA-binding transcriptional LysR family regulator